MNSPKAINTNFFFQLFVKLLPDRIKRLMLLASFAAVAKDTKESDEQAIHSLNQILQLAVNDNALKLPIHVSSMIWTNVNSYQKDLDTLKEHQRQQCDLQRCAARIVNGVPDWFLYGSKEEMITDFLGVFSEPVLNTQNSDTAVI